MASTTTKTYVYAVIPTQGCYGNGSNVSPAYCTDDRERATKKAASMTREYQRAMRSRGGSSGGYRVIEWGYDCSYSIPGHIADRVPSV